MAQFDFYQQGERQGYWLDCQSDLFDDLNVRYAVPLVPLDQAPNPVKRLNPVFQIDGAPFVMLTQFSGAIVTAELKQKAGSLERQRYEILNALDFLTTGV